MNEIRTEPRFSVTKLAEYVTASPARRRRLILDQIAPPAYQVQRYQYALPVAQRFVCDPRKGVDYLFAGASRLRDRLTQETVSGHTRECLADSARALEAFTAIASQFRIRRVLAVPGRRRDESMSISGVRVSVLPDINLLDPATEAMVGAVKFHCSRTRPLKPDALRYLAVILFAHCRARSSAVRPSRCIGADIFSGQVEAAPTAIKARLGEVEAACEEIAERWASLVEVASRSNAMRP